jgi:hypothetical protein
VTVAFEVDPATTADPDQPREVGLLEVVRQHLDAATEGAYHGHEGWEQFVADTRESFDAFEPRFELRDLGEQVLAWGMIRVSGKGSGIDMEFPVGGIFDCSGGKITRWQDFGSKEKALEAAGVSEKPLLLSATRSGDAGPRGAA